MIKGSRVELYEFHILYRTFGTVNHCLTITRSNTGVCCCLIDGTAATGTHQCYLTEISIYLFCFWVEHISTEAFDVWSASCYLYAEMMLGDDLYCKMIFFDFYGGVFAYGLHQSSLNFRPGIIRMVQYSEFRMSPFAVQVEFSTLFFVEVHAPVHKFTYLCRSVSYHLFHSFSVADEITGNHCVLNMFVEVI